MKILAIIPARGGSKEIPYKNIVLLKGKPLIAYSIEIALKSKYINRIIVTTDNKEIARVAQKYGAEVPFMRPKKYAQDLSPDIDVFYHALTWLKENENYIPDIVVNMRPVCPLRKVELLDKAIKLFLDNPEADSLRSMYPAKQNPYKMWKKAGKYVTPIVVYGRFKESYNMPRQALPQALYQHGDIDMVRGEIILKYKMMSGKKVMPFICENLVDIDYPEDLLLAEKLLKGK